MKILFCTNQVNTHGGIERILSQKINFLIQDLGYEVYLSTFEQNNKKQVYKLDDNCKIKDLNVNYDSNASYYHPKNLLKVVQHYFKLKKEIKTINPDVVISISFTPDQYFIPFINKKIPKIKELHSSGSVVAKGLSDGSVLSKFYRNYLFNIFKKYNKLILLTKDEKQYFEPKNTVVIPNFTDFEIKNNIERENTIIAVGRIADVKNFQDLVDIWHLIYEKYPDWKIKIFGDGDDEYIQNLKSKIENLGLTNSFLIFPSTDNVQIEMQKASIFAMTSLTECFPMVLLEAQICGLPIVSYDCPNGPRNIIKNKNDGFLIEDKNKNSFAEHLILLIENDNLRATLSQNAQLNVQRFSKINVIDKWKQLLKSLQSI